MASNQTLVPRIDQLIAYFNRGVLDVPDGLLDRNAVLMMNGLPYESRLGRSADDPLVRLIARGPAGYRFVAQALRHALDEAVGAVGAFEVAQHRAVGTIGLHGRLRGSGTVFDAPLGVTLTMTSSGTISTVDVTIADDALAKLREARSR
jgi:hypothetical protein